MWSCSTREAGGLPKTANSTDQLVLYDALIEPDVLSIGVVFSGLIGAIVGAVIVLMIWGYFQTANEKKRIGR